MENTRTGKTHSTGQLDTLACAKRGDEFEFVGIDDELARVQALRFGVCEGCKMRCLTRVPAGPIVMEVGRQEIAFGRDLARRIRVRRLQRAC